MTAATTEVGVSHTTPTSAFIGRFLLNLPVRPGLLFTESRVSIPPRPARAGRRVPAYPGCPAHLMSRS